MMYHSHESWELNVSDRVIFLETSLDLTDLSEEELIEILNPEKMVKPSD